MLILSNFRDYYDSCASFGVDITVPFRREQSSFELNDETGPNGAMIKDFKSLVSSAADRLPPMPGRSPLVFVGFCGKVYAGLHTRVVDATGKLYEQRFYQPEPPKGVSTQCLWDLRDIHPDDHDKYLNELRYYRSKGDKKLGDWMIAKGSGAIGEWIEIFQRHNLVSFAIYDHQVFINPRLQDLRFQRVIGGVEAFQMIEMFISGVLGVSPNPMIELTDKDRIQAHGFDHYSFRKPPTKRG